MGSGPGRSDPARGAASTAEASRPAASSLWPRTLILLAAVLFSTGGTAIKSCEFSGVQVACLRSGIAALVLIAFLPGLRLQLKWRSCLVALAFAVTMLLFVLANKRTTAAHTIFLQSTAPLYILLLAPLLLRERAQRAELLTLPLLAGGLFLLLFAGQAPQASAPQPFEGNLLAMSAGPSWALTILGLRFLSRGAEPGNPGLGAVVLGNALACLFTLPFAWPFAGAGAADWLGACYLGVFQIGVAYLCLTKGIGRVPAFEAALLLMVEPVLNPLWSFLVHGERLAGLAVLGGLLVLLATLGRALLQRRVGT
ncbi:MAG: EamA family transporter [Planctomycetota bacterium]|nr:MAG: EamA family transporter [Planctomycetota bacterium]